MTIAFREAGSAQLSARQPSSTPHRFRGDGSIAISTSWNRSGVRWPDRISVASPYQGYEWIRLWHEHVSGPLGQEPVIIVGSDRSGAPLFIWPLVAQRLGPLRLACFFGGKHATLNMPLWRRDIADTFTASRHARCAVTGGAAAARSRPAAAAQPAGALERRRAIPCMTLAHQRSNEDNFVLNISTNGPAVIEQQISGTMRSRLRNKERKLAKLKGYRYVRATTADDVDRQLAFFFSRRKESCTRSASRMPSRSRVLKISFARPVIRALNAASR